jgi:hypothetical protein
MDTHERTIPCNHCDKKFYGPREAEMHVARWHMDDGKPRVSQQEDFDSMTLQTVTI